MQFCKLSYFNSDNKESIHKPYREIYPSINRKMEHTGWRKQVHTLKAKTDTYIVARKNTVGVQELANLQKGQDH